jgi:TonB family protein
MKRILTAIFMTLATFCVVAGQTNTQEARAEVNRGAAHYRNGNYAEAQRSFERALELDPTWKDGPSLIARAILQQYKPGDETPENIAKGREALAAYDKIFAADPDSEEAFNAIFYLYRQMKDEETERQWLWQRATNASVPASKRAIAYIILASKQWDCAYDVTEANKQTDPIKAVIKYKKPSSQVDLDKARGCASEGMSLVEQAANLDPNNRHVWSQKYNLLRELSKLSEMEDDAGQKAYYEQQFIIAQETYNKMTEEERQKKASKNDSPKGLKEPDSLNAAPPAMPKKPFITGGVLNGKAISKPMPSYPAEAKRERAQGVVSVRIVVDEEGKVISAEAVSGHPLLHQTSVTAAYQARFSPTRLHGQLVKVTGVITYNFMLQ